MSEADKAVASMLPGSMETYASMRERAAMRRGCGDAASLCDAIARDLVAEHRGRNGKGALTKRGAELQAVAKRCGDAIWAMREMMTASPASKER